MSIKDIFLPTYWKLGQYRHLFIAHLCLIYFLLYKYCNMHTANTYFLRNNFYQTTEVLSYIF